MKEKINEIFDKDGIDIFRKIEKEILPDLNLESDTVVDAGGGLPFHFDNMEAMMERGATIYL